MAGHTLTPVHFTGPCSAIGLVSGNGCESDCRSRRCKLDLALVEIDHEIISTVILLPSAEFKKGCCQLHAKVCARSTGQLLVQACPGKIVVR